MNIAVILISGKGSRMNLELPKQFIMVKNKPLYIYSVHAFYTNKNIDRLLLVTSKEYAEQVRQEVRKYGYIHKPIDVIEGGEERYLSVKYAVNYLSSLGCHIEDKVLIHDGVRPNISPKIIKENINGLNIEPTVLTAIEADASYAQKKRVDTIHFLNNKYYRAQTPQSFRYGVLKEVYNKVTKLNPYPFTDDISASISVGFPFVIATGEENNYKITTIEDLERFKKEHE